jgi:hypothetical protein
VAPNSNLLCVSVTRLFCLVFRKRRKRRRADGNRKEFFKRNPLPLRKDHVEVIQSDAANRNILVPFSSGNQLLPAKLARYLEIIWELPLDWPYPWTLVEWSPHARRSLDLFVSRKLAASPALSVVPIFPYDEYTSSGAPPFPALGLRNRCLSSMSDKKINERLEGF